MNFVEDEVLIESPQGEIKGRRQYFTHPGGVTVIPVIEDPQTKEKSLVLIRQFRTPLGKVIYEFPAGKRDPGEQPLATAKRELREETGYIADIWIDAGCIYPSPGYCTEILYMFIAKGLHAGESSPDEGEIIETEIMSLDQAINKIMIGEIRDSKTINGVFFVLHENQFLQS